MKDPRIIEVVWSDSAQFLGWQIKPTPEEHEISTCRTVGFLVGENKTQITIALNTDDVQNFGQLISIPKVNVKKRRYLK